MPVVAEVVHVKDRQSPVRHVGGHLHRPIGLTRLLIHEFIARDTEPSHFAPSGIHNHCELVKVAIQPAHRILYGDMKVPERVLLGHLDSAPHQRFSVAEHDKELMHPVCRLRSAGRPARG
jgi:hypothetical protein